MHTVFTVAAANDTHMRSSTRERTVPIPATITPVPGYPSKLSVFKMAASKYWQVRCWVAGRTHRRSTQTQSLRMAQSFARTFYEQLLAQRASLHCKTSTTYSEVLNDTPTIKPNMTFAAIAAQMMANEQARVERGEFSRGSFKVLRNRLDAHILPRWGKLLPSAVDHAQLLAFT